MAPDGVTGILGYQVPKKLPPVKPGVDGQSKGPAFGGVGIGQPQPQAQPQKVAQAGSEKWGTFDWRSLNNIKDLSPAVGGVGADTGNKLQLWA